MDSKMCPFFILCTRAEISLKAVKCRDSVESKGGERKEEREKL